MPHCLSSDQRLTGFRETAFSQEPLLPAPVGWAEARKRAVERRRQPLGATRRNSALPRTSRISWPGTSGRSCRRSLRRCRIIQAIIERRSLPALGDHKVRAITRDDVVRLHRAVATSATTSLARARSAVRTQRRMCCRSYSPRRSSGLARRQPCAKSHAANSRQHGRCRRQRLSPKAGLPSGSWAPDRFPNIRSWGFPPAGALQFSCLSLFVVRVKT